MNQNFKWLWFGETTSKLGSSISAVSIPLVAVTILQASTFQVGLLMAASWLPWLLIGLPAGAWVDRVRRRPLMLACNAFSALVLLSVPVAAAMHRLTVTHLLIAAMLMGTSTVFFQTSFSVFIPSLLSKEDLQRGNARLHGSESAAQVAGPGVAGLIAQVFGVLGGLVADAISFGISAFSLSRIKVTETLPAVHKRQSLRSDITSGLKFLLHEPYLRSFAFYGSSANLALTGYQAILVVFLVRVVGLPPGGVGAVMMAMAVGGVIGAACATRISARFGSARGIVVASLSGAPFALLIPLTGPGWRLIFVIAGGVMIGAGVVASNVMISSFRQGYTPREMLGRVTVSSQFLAFGSIPLGALLGGVLGDALGIVPTMWVMTGIVAVTPLILVLSPVGKRRDLPAAAPAVLVPA